jgi:hypothetical protein
MAYGISFTFEVPLSVLYSSQHDSRLYTALYNWRARLFGIMCGLSMQISPIGQMAESALSNLKSISSPQNLAATKTKNNVEKLWSFQYQYIYMK